MGPVLASLPNNPTRLQLQRRLDYLDVLTRAPVAPLNDTLVRDGMKSGNPPAGALAYLVNDPDFESEGTMMIPPGLDRGNFSRFSGLLYSHDNVWVTNSVNVIGGIWCHAPARELGADPETLDGVSVGRGDIFLDNGCQLLMDEEYLDSGASQYSPGSPEVSAWSEF